MLPMPCGTWCPVGGGRAERMIVFDARGPCHTVRAKADPVKGYATTMVAETTPGGARVRPLHPKEAWCAQGGSAELWDRLGEAGQSVDDRMKAAARALPRRTARWILLWAERELRGAQAAGQDDARAGVGPDPDRDCCDGAVKMWLKAWRQTPDHPGPLYLAAIASARAPAEDANLAALLDDETTPCEELPEDPKVGDPPGGGRAGAVTVSFADEAMSTEDREEAPRKAEPLRRGKRTPRSRSAPAPYLAKPAAWRLGGHRPPTLDGNGHKRVEGLDRLATEAMLSKLAEGTRDTYRNGWRNWLLWRRLRGQSPYLQGETRDDRLEDEDDLIRFVVYLYQVMGRRATTIRQRLFAIRYAHTLAGFGDVTGDRRRLWTALEGLRRWDGTVKRKLPATPRMLLWLREYLFGPGTESRAEAVTLWAALMVGYFFMLRASEYLVSGRGAWPGSFEASTSKASPTDDPKTGWASATRWSCQLPRPRRTSTTPAVIGTTSGPGALCVWSPPWLTCSSSCPSASGARAKQTRPCFACRTGGRSRGRGSRTSCAPRRRRAE